MRNLSKTLAATFVLMYVFTLLITLLLGDGIGVKILPLVFLTGYFWYKYSDRVLAFIQAKQHPDTIVVGRDGTRDR